ncbi:MAG: hypothetical protein FWF50_00080 [Defluviitaleaceae bacterium]|nr:hypothetical protein [Defluviitaleaceae bacterium]
MHKINILLSELTEELFKIKNFQSEISLEEMIEFYINFNYCAGNLVTIGINAGLIDLVEVKNEPIPQELASSIISAFIQYNKYEYNTYVIDSLFTMCITGYEPAYNYLNKILDTDEKIKQSEREFYGKIFDDIRLKLRSNKNNKNQL